MIARRLREAAQRFGDRLVVQTPRESLTYQELDTYADACALALQSKGVAPGHVVALSLPSGANWLISAVACNRIGAVFAGVSPVLSNAERENVLKLLRPQLTIAAPSTLDGLPLRTRVSVMSETSHLLDDTPSTATRNEQPVHLNTSQSDATLNVDWPSDHSAVICLTSGTTGTPKAALFHNRQLAAIEQIDLGATQGVDLETLWGTGSHMLASTQFAHVGMALKLPWYFRLGVTLQVMDRWNADDALRLISKHRISTLGTVAPQLALMLRSPLLEELDVSSVERIIAGGAPSPDALIAAACEAFDAPYSVRWSSTESGGVGLSTPFIRPTHTLSDDQSRNSSPANDGISIGENNGVSTIGTPRDTVEVRIDTSAKRSSAHEPDVDGRETDARIGELLLRSPAVMSGYYNDQPATESTITADGWLRTGDLGYQDVDGNYYVVGRLSDMYIRGGYNVYPNEVEAALARHDSIDDIAVIGYPDDVLGEIGIAAVVVNKNCSITLDELREFGESHLAKYKLPDQLVCIDELPYTAAQKVDRKTLLQKISSQIQ